MEPPELQSVQTTFWLYTCDPYTSVGYTRVILIPVLVTQCDPYTSFGYTRVILIPVLVTQCDHYTSFGYTV